MYNPLTGRETEFRRLIGKYSGEASGPCLLVLAGIHGNEPSGVLALEAVFERLQLERPDFCGTLVGIAGNLTALQAQVRFADRDLNRIWRRPRIEELKAGSPPESSEERELLEVVRTIEAHVPTAARRHFLDCHTTSSESVPYISTLADDRCLQLAEQVPVHSVIGGSDHLQGITDEYLIETGYTGFTFEAGQHTCLASLEAQHAAIWVALQVVGCVEDVPQPLYTRLAKAQIDGHQAFRVEYTHRILPNSGFRMEPGFFNFQRVRPGDLLAREYDRPLYSRWDARVFMPLYQPLGDEGFCIVTPR